LREERVCRYAKRVLEEDDRGELRCEDEVGHGRRGQRRRCGTDTSACHRFLTWVRAGFSAG
jgi:hypothetical protein